MPWNLQTFSRTFGASSDLDAFWLEGTEHSVSGGRLHVDGPGHGVNWKAHYSTGGKWHGDTNGSMQLAVYPDLDLPEVAPQVFIGLTLQVVGDGGDDLTVRIWFRRNYSYTGSVLGDGGWGVSFSTVENGVESAFVHHAYSSSSPVYRVRLLDDDSTFEVSDGAGGVFSAWGTLPSTSTNFNNPSYDWQLEVRTFNAAEVPVELEFDDLVLTFTQFAVDPPETTQVTATAEGRWSLVENTLIGVKAASVARFMPV